MKTAAPDGVKPSSPVLLKRELGVFGSMMMGLGSIVGTGIFVSIGIAAGIAGPSVVVAIAIAAFSEIIKQSPYADGAALPQLEPIVTASAHASDPDRAEFAALFATATGLLGP